MDEVTTVFVGDEFVISRKMTARPGFAFNCRVPPGQIVPCVKGDIVGTTGMVNLEQSDGAVVGGDLHADVVTIDLFPPVGDPVGIDLAAEDSD